MKLLEENSLALVSFVILRCSERKTDSFRKYWRRLTIREALTTSTCEIFLIKVWINHKPHTVAKTGLTQNKADVARMVGLKSYRLLLTTGPNHKF